MCFRESRKTIRELKGQELLAVLRKVEDRGTVETAHHIRQSFGRYSVTRSLHIEPIAQVGREEKRS
jgi:hypothetical protein